LTVTRPTLEDVYLELTAGDDSTDRRPASVSTPESGRRRRGRRRRDEVRSQDG
jgi:hypothetical protein